MKEKPSASKPKPPKRNLMKDLGKDLGLGFSSTDYNQAGSTDLGLIRDGQGHYLAGNMSVLADLTLFSNQKQNNFAAPNPSSKLADNYSVGSQDTPFPSYPQQSFVNRTAEKIRGNALDALSESFEPNGLFQKRLKKNSMSACKPQNFGRYRKMSH